MTKKLTTHSPDMKNMVASAVNRRIKGEEKAPTVPIALTHPKANERTAVGYNSAT